jgi:hypothetical protein
MTALDSNPTSPNFLSPLNFRLMLKRAPSLNFYAQRVSIPPVEVKGVGVQNPFTEIFHHGDDMSFGDFEVTFAVDEDLENYLEIYNWLRGLAKPSTPAEYRALKAGDPLRGLGLASGITLLIMSSAKRPLAEIDFHNCIPTNLSGMTFDTTLSDVDYVTATASFRYDIFDVNKL